MKTNNKTLRRARIKKGIRKKVRGTSELPRLCVYRSNTSIYVQLIDDVNQKTVVAASSQDADIAKAKGTRVESSKQVGIKIAEKAKKAGINACIFDRNGFLYHGRIKSLAEGAREGGLKF
ncbi:MAG: large subunit ribosomal protein L18 [Sphingobacteriales bacterium]|jgi:large subunit ribosomal protein L18